MTKIIYFTNSAWTLYNFRINLMAEMKRQGFEVAACAPLDKYAQQFDKHEIRFLDVPMQLSSVNPWAELRVVLRLFHLYRQERPALVHHFSLKPIVYGSLAAQLARVPLIVNTVTGLGYIFIRGGLLQKLVTSLLWLALRPPAWTTFQNPDDQRLFQDLRLASERSALILGSGVDTKKFAPLPSTMPNQQSTREVTFLMFGRMMWEKGVEEYVEAARKLQAKLHTKRDKNKARFVLLGGAGVDNPTSVAEEWIDNPLTIPGEWLERQATEGHVEWYPHDDDVLPYIRQADVVVLPSYYREGVPRTLLESMACGKPLITTDVPGCREAVEDGVNGFLVPAKDSDSLANAMLRFVENGNLRKRMGEASRERALTLFADHIVIEKTLDIYKKAGLKISAPQSPMKQVLQQ